MNEIEKLKKDLQLKKKIFHSIEKGDKKSYQKIFKENSEIYYYFKKFRNPVASSDYFMFGDFERQRFYFYQGWFNQIEEDLQRLGREIEEKENRFEQRNFIRKQQEFIDLQKQDIIENKKDRKRLNNFTLILALGVLGTIVYYISQLLIQFKTSPTLHLLLITGICCLGLTLIFLFILSVFNVKEEFIKFWKGSWPQILILVFLIGLFGFFLFTIDDVSTTMGQESELNKINSQFQTTNSILNESVQNQKETIIRLETIILNQNSNS